MQTLAKVFLSAATGAGLLAATAVSASAGIACVGPVCWHTHEAYEYPPDAPSNRASGRLALGAK